MPHFYFHVFNGSGETHDDEGIDLPDVQSARNQALIAIRSILSDELGRGQLDFGGMIRITDQDDHLLLEVPFTEAVEVRHGSHGR